ncbi:hypothetical protein D8674_032049 [Pyrus ussuriensis x Pyrus communis]|uniref:Uncharacterized protein n=1 Tax=Pyrus ussuriensis x Pyrus communis TaxID=2448454 RepID=A0A5N5F0G6_9ROSA|nr:hypothetical protein D8674_032049 [Pyrus ussuriensis x Pyrus communis]
MVADLSSSYWFRNDEEGESGFSGGRARTSWAKIAVEDCGVGVWCSKLLQELQSHNHGRGCEVMKEKGDGEGAKEKKTDGSATKEDGTRSPLEIEGSR